MVSSVKIWLKKVVTFAFEQARQLSIYHRKCHGDSRWQVPARDLLMALSVKFFQPTLPRARCGQSRDRRCSARECLWRNWRFFVEVS